MRQSIGEVANDFIQKWRVVNTPALKALAFEEPVSHLGLRNALARLRLAKLILTMQIGRQSYHFHPVFEKRCEKLKPLNFTERLVKANAWGLEHHLQVIEIGYRLAKLLPEAQFTPNVFADFVSFSEGSFDLQGRKFSPDLSIGFQRGSLTNFSYIEVERHFKSKPRYRERWFTYQNDPRLHSCLYWVFDFNVEQRLQTAMNEYLASSYQSHRIQFGTICTRSPSVVSKDLQVTVVSRTGLSRTNIQDFLLGDVGSRQVHPNLEISRYLNDFNSFEGFGRQTTLSLPSSTSLEVANANERVVCLPNTINLMKEDGRN